MKERVLAAWTASDLHDYPDYITVTRIDEQVIVRVRGSDGSKEVTQLTMPREAFLRLAIHAVSGALT